MLSHVSLGVRDLERTKVFYDAVLGPPGFVLAPDGHKPEAAHQ